jgi:hypothetical protein
LGDGSFAYGRYQTYSDLADFQKGDVPIEEIIRRADPTGKKKSERVLSYMMTRRLKLTRLFPFLYAA